MNATQKRYPRSEDNEESSDRDEVCKAANKAISLLQVDSRTADVAATFTSHAPGNRGQHVVEIFAMVVDDAWTTTLTTWEPPRVEETQSMLQLHLEDNYRQRCEQCVRKDLRGSMNSLRDQQLHEVMVHVRRRSDTILGPHESGQKTVERLERCPCVCRSGRTSRELTGTLDTRQYNKWRTVSRGEGVW